MSLRRTALARKSELRRQSELRRTPMARGKELKTRSVKAARPRETGPTRSTRMLVVDRAGGCCELCGVLLHDGYAWVEVHSFHHRQARGMGGTNLDAANSPSNLLLLCGTGTTGCHGFVTAHPTAAEEEGWVVRHGTDPADVLVTVVAGWGITGLTRVEPGATYEAHVFTKRVLLAADGGYTDPPPPPAPWAMFQIPSPGKP